MVPRLEHLSNPSSLRLNRGNHISESPQHLGLCLVSRPVQLSPRPQLLPTIASLPQALNKA